jgi:hypothetical protein
VIHANQPHAFVTLNECTGGIKHREPIRVTVEVVCGRFLFAKTFRHGTISSFTYQIRPSEYIAATSYASIRPSTACSLSIFLLHELLLPSPPLFVLPHFKMSTQSSILNPAVNAFAPAVQAAPQVTYKFPHSMSSLAFYDTIGNRRYRPDKQDPFPPASQTYKFTPEDKVRPPKRQREDPREPPLTIGLPYSGHLLQGQHWYQGQFWYQPVSEHQHPPMYQSPFADQPQFVYQPQHQVPYQYPQQHEHVFQSHPAYQPLSPYLPQHQVPYSPECQYSPLHQDPHQPAVSSNSNCNGNGVNGTGIGNGESTTGIGNAKGKGRRTRKDSGKANGTEDMDPVSITQTADVEAKLDRKGKGRATENVNDGSFRVDVDMDDADNEDVFLVPQLMTMPLNYPHRGWESC